MTTQSQVDRLRKDIASLKQSDAREAEKEAKAASKLNRATQSVQRASNPSTRNSRMREEERARLELARIQKRRADLDGKIATKESSLASSKERLVREQNIARKKIDDQQKRLLRTRQELERGVKIQPIPQRRMKDPAQQMKKYDFFICHAGEDKDAIVRGLAEALRSRGKDVWYDEFILRAGMSLRRSIDQGLANSKFGVVILSEHFFGKEWPEQELNGLFSLRDGSERRVIPVWHGVSRDEVARHSPMLADKVALNTSLLNVDELSDELCSILDG